MILENLTTERLLFRPLTLDDKGPLLEFFNDPVATEFLSISGDLEAFVDGWLAAQLRRYDQESGGLHIVELKGSGQILGQCGLLRQFVDGIPKWEVGYHFLHRFWGNGYAAEAAIACRDFCFENEMAETLISLIHPDNLRSQAVARRNGMDFWKQTMFKGHPKIVYRIRREDWEKIKT